MIGKLLQLSLLHSLGRGSKRPLRKAALRIGYLLAGSAGFSWIFGQATAQLPFAHHPKSWLVCIWISGAAFGCAGVSFIASSGLYAHRKDTFVSLLKTWPIASKSRWLTCMLPRLIIAALGVVLISVPAVIAGTGWGIESSLTVSLLVIGYVLAIIGLIIVTHLLDILLPVKTSQPQVRTALPPSWWFLKKAWRSRSISLSLLTAFMLSILVASFALQRGFNDIAALSFVAALLGASFCADIRSLARSAIPAEIVALRGTLIFMRHQLVVACVGVIVIAIPLLTASLLHNQAPLSLQLCILGVVQLLAGLSAGILSGSLLTPGARDISGQLASVLLCLAVLFLPSYIPYVRSLETNTSITVTLLLSVSCIFTSYCIEYKRNPYYWRHHA